MVHKTLYHQLNGGTSVRNSNAANVISEQVQMLVTGYIAYVIAKQVYASALQLLPFNTFSISLARIIEASISALRTDILSTLKPIGIAFFEA